MVGLAFLGGVVLNVMPCVLPVLALKVFHAIENNGRERATGVAYAFGTMAAFAAFALIIIGLRESGQVLGWGMHFRHPPFLAGLIVLIFAFGLNALGVFEITISATGAGHSQGTAAAFFNGVFAAVMSTPCTAPFLVTAAGFALAADTTWWQTLALFVVIGFGLAFPYLLIAFVPRLSRALPRPGAWMVTFKQLMGFTLLGTAVWLLGALQRQVTPASFINFVWFLLILACGLWAAEHFGGIQYARRRRASVLAVTALVLLAAGESLLRFERAQAITSGPGPDALVQNDAIVWRRFDPSVVARAQAAGQLVFMDYTADWCAACKTNEQLFLNTQAVRQAILDANILPVKADMTNENAILDAWLQKLGRSGIPAYVIYFPDGTYELLPVTITAEMVVERMRAAAERFPSRMPG